MLQPSASLMLSSFKPVEFLGIDTSINVRSEQFLHRRERPLAGKLRGSGLVVIIRCVSSYFIRRMHRFRVGRARLACFYKRSFCMPKDVDPRA